MANVQFKKATKSQAKARVALIGPSGSGKTYSSLAIASGMCSKIALIDTERGSASKYAGRFDFDVLELESFEPDRYVEAIAAAEAAGYEALVIDSLSHAWIGKGGALDQVENASRRSQSNNKYFAWRDVTPMHNRLVDAVVGCRCHVFATMRAKTEYVIETNDKGKQVPRKIGLAAIQRDGFEYEFDVVGDITLDHDWIISKTRCEELNGRVFREPGADVAEILKRWLTDGAEEAPKPIDIAIELLAKAETNEAIDAAKSDIRSMFAAGQLSERDMSVIAKAGEKARERVSQDQSAA